MNVTYYECKNPHACTEEQYVCGACCSDRPHKCKFAKPCGIPFELADYAIRIFDACGRYGIDLEQAIRVKMEYNKNRPYKHGKKF